LIVVALKEIEGRASVTSPKLPLKNWVFRAKFFRNFIAGLKSFFGFFTFMDL
jgi:hypothetical protein